MACEAALKADVCEPQPGGRQPLGKIMPVRGRFVLLLRFVLLFIAPVPCSSRLTAAGRFRFSIL